MSIAHCPRIAPPRARRAFTLVELLVVIGIIALLIAILLPALNKARQQGNWAKCASNMKQLVTSMIMYTNDYKGAFPWRGSGQQGPRPDKNKPVAEFPGANDWIHWQDVSTGYTPGPTVDINESALAIYLNAKGDKLQELFRCPSDEWASHTQRAGYGVYQYSFTMNQNVTLDDRTTVDSNDVTRWQFRRITQVKRNAEKALFVEEKNPKDGRWIPTGIGNKIPTSSDVQDFDGDDALTSRHAKGGNVAFFDTHVEVFKNTDFIEAIARTNRSNPFAD
jgi:prepilin-type N-terminal cleavage/methylation domain-containing protein/prepilin-type processing-associated H-X9-DG protein